MLIFQASLTTRYRLVFGQSRIANMLLYIILNFLTWPQKSDKKANKKISNVSQTANYVTV